MQRGTQGCRLKQVTRTGSLRRRLLGNNQKGTEGHEDIQEKSTPDTRKTMFKAPTGNMPEVFK